MPYVLLEEKVIVKLRLTKDDIRFRVEPREVSLLKKKGVLKKIIYFPDNNILSYAVVIKEDTKKIEMSFENNQLVLSVPREKFEKLAVFAREGALKKNYFISNRKISVSLEIDWMKKSKNCEHS
jgi:hypothetical protein